MAGESQPQFIVLISDRINFINIHMRNMDAQKMQPQSIIKFCLAKDKKKNKTLLGTVYKYIKTAEH